MLKPGDKAPDFELASQTGERIRLSQFEGTQNVVLFFYPKDDTPGCTKEACAFRDRYEDFVSRDTAVLGISSDSASSHDKFAAKHRLPFPLLADQGGAVRQKFGVNRTFGILPGRATFVIDKTGLVRNVFVSQFQFEAHIQDSLQALERTGSQAKAMGA